MSISNQTVRVVDYLDDKIQSQADLDNLDALLESVKEQQGLLRQQLYDAEIRHDEDKERSSKHSQALFDQARSFRKQQMSIDKRMMVITQSETSDDAVQKFDSTMQKMRKLDIASGYIDMLTEVDSLSAQAKQNFKASPDDALKPYIRLQDIARNIKTARPAAEDAAPHLMDHIDRTVRDLWQGMKDAFSADFEKTLKKMKWPPKDAASRPHLAGDTAREWAHGVERLLQLQGPALKDRESDSSAPQPLVLLPLEVMIKPVALRFKYHFSGDRPTNRKDKPEFFLSHIADLLNTHEMFFVEHLQPILSTHFKDSPLGMNAAYIDATSALITAMLPMLREKLYEVLPQISQEPQLLSHLMHELISFDTSLRDTWGYEGGHGAEGWAGVTAEILQTWFPRWLEAEKEFALNRYRNIIEQKDSGEIDFESVNPGETKPTKAAMRVNDLLESVTDRYKPLASFTQKLRFLMDIQIAIFDRYHSRLHDALEAFLTMTSTIARTVQGVSKEDMVQLRGLGGVERLMRVYVSADYLERKMRDWSDDVFFLELWDELQYRARRKENRNSNVAVGLTLEAIADRTSSAVGQEEDTGALFDETSTAYHKLRVRTEGIVEDHLFSSVRDSLKAYRASNPWASLSPVESAVSNAISTELDSTIQLLTSYLGFLGKCLATAPLRRIARHLAVQMQTWFWNNLISDKRFSTSGVEQLTRDLEGIWAVFDQQCRQGYGRSSMPRLAEAIVLMSLPMDAADWHEPVTSDDKEVPQAATGMTLQEAEQRIFRSNEDTRLVLEELGLDRLSESEARMLVERRVELGN